MAKSNFSVVPNPTAKAGTTLENLKAAVNGETGATTKYAAYAKAAEEQGFPAVARLFAATSKAEQIHINLEAGLIRKSFEPDFENPTAEAPEPLSTDLNLIDAAKGEIWETSDMYPQFIKAAEAEGNEEAVRIFTRAKLAEGFHAERYIDAYNTIDKPTDEHYYVCPVCGYIHKGKTEDPCPICGAKASVFLEF